MTAWPTSLRRGTAAELHALELPSVVGRELWHLEVARPAVVLGSTQPSGAVDVDRADAAGVEVARRRSGGGAVWVAPGEVTWIDVLLPRGDPRWDDDVVRAGEWLGEAWAAAVRALGGGSAGAVEVVRGRAVPGPWGDAICFAGRGPGEVLVDGAKAVGIAQRRTRAGARFQCAVLHRWDPAPLIDVLALDEDARRRAVGELRGAGVAIDATSSDVVAALREALTRAD